MYSIISWIIISYVVIMYIGKVENKVLISNWLIIVIKEVGIEYSILLIVYYIGILMIYRFISKEILDIILLSNWFFIISVSSINIIFVYMGIYMINLMFILPLSGFKLS